jgi:LysM repeat protein
VDDVQKGLAGIPAASRATARLHKVEPGENLSAIATRYKTTAVLISGANGLEKGAELSAGDRLLIPGAYHEAAAKPARAVVATKGKSGRKSSSATKKTVASAKKPATGKAPASATTAKLAAPHKPATTVAALIR